MEIIEQSNNWITAISNGRWIQAKIFDEGSEFGINDGRVSKLSISRNGMRDGKKNFFDQMAYNYDRGLDHHDDRNLPDELLNKIVAELETLPKFGE